MTKRHTCGGPVFGRKTPGCPRCDELLAGADPVVWSYDLRRKQQEQVCRWNMQHDCSKSRCAPICTFGDW